MRRIKRVSDLADLAAQEIRAAILRGDLSPGSRIRQEELAARLAVSRAPIRQALVVLEREGLVQTDHRRVTVVAALDAVLIRELYQLREAIDRYVAETLALRIDIDWTRAHELVAAGQAAAARDDVAVLMDFDLRFHTGQYDAVGNRILADLMHSQWINMRRVMAALNMVGYYRTIWDEHAAILGAIVTHDAARAGTLAAAHASAACETLIERLARGSTHPPQRDDPQRDKEVWQPRERHRSSRAVSRSLRSAS